LGNKAYTVIWRGYVEQMMYKHSPKGFDETNVDQNWTRTTGEKGWEPQSFEPKLSDSYVGGDTTPSNYMKFLDAAASWGMRPTLIDSAAVWLDAMNPSDKWTEYMCEDNGGPLNCRASSSVSQRIQLQPGWNFVSSRVAPDDPSLKQVFADVDGLSAVKTEDGRSYIPSLKVDQLTSWSSSEGYKVHVEETQETTFTGEPIARDTPIELKEGWNLLPYYPGEPMDAASALASIEDVLKVARDEDGNEYAPSLHNEIGNMTPGESYAVYVTQDAILTYPTASE
jgi:hypothetical protein